MPLFIRIEQCNTVITTTVIASGCYAIKRGCVPVLACRFAVLANLFVQTFDSALLLATHGAITDV